MDSSEMFNEEKKSKREKKSSEIAHDGSKISKLVEEKKINKWKIVQRLGYSKNSKNAYKRIVDEEAPLGICSLSNLAGLLGVDVFDILKDEHRTRISSVKLIDFENCDGLNQFLHQEEKAYRGRIAVFNSFPSMIYYPDDGQARLVRYRYLTEESVTNAEYYPIRSLLNFGFSYFSDFSKEDKIKAIRNFIDAHSSKHGRLTNDVYVITDVDKYTSSPFAADCEILGDDYLLITAPFYPNAVFTVKSVDVVKRIKKAIDKPGENIIDRNKILKMLKILIDCVEEEKSIVDFIVELKKKDSTFFGLISDILSDKLRSDVKKEVATKLS